MTKTQDFLDRINSIAQALGSISKWQGTGTAFGHIEAKTKDDYIYEFYCCMRVIEDLNRNHQIDYIEGHGENANCFPKKPAPKENGWARFDVYSKEIRNHIAQICAGTKIYLNSHEDGSHSPDIQILTANCPDRPLPEHALQVMDAKFKGKSGSLEWDEIKDFATVVRDLDVPKLTLQKYIFNTEQLGFNCLITNGGIAQGHVGDCLRRSIRQLSMGNEMPDNKFTYRGAVLIIGSLYWDNERRAWRDQYLNHQHSDIKVSVPIRYGRYSKKRQTHTMVFSTDFLESESGGTARVIEFRQGALLAEEVIIAAKDLSSAEGPNDNFFIKGDPDWCCLVIWINPILAQERTQALLEHWQKAYESRLTEATRLRYKMQSETDVVFDSLGVLRFKWPNELSHLDFVIATQTKPRRDEHGNNGDYLNASDLAKSIIAHPEYFAKNRINGFKSAEDDEIIEAIRSTSNGVTDFLYNLGDMVDKDDLVKIDPKFAHLTFSKTPV